MEHPTGIFDAAIHPFHLPDVDLHDLVFFGVQAAVLVLGDEIDAVDGEELLEIYGRMIREEVPRFRRAGLAPFVALGIHPRRIPERGLERVLAELPAFFGEARVVAIGPAGLEEGGRREEQVLLRQIELAQQLGSRIYVRTPERDKLRHTRRTLSLLRESEIDPGRVLVGQVDGQTVRLVRACGFSAALSVSPMRIRAEAAVELVRQLGAGDLLLASELGAGAGDLLALPRTAWLLERAGLSRPVIRRVIRENALAFFGIDRAAL